MGKKREIVMRHQIADYLNVGTEAEPNFVLMGTGFTTLDEEPGAQSESTKYVNEASASSSIIGYETTFPFEAEHIITEDAINALYEVARNHKVGSEAEFEYCRVELWKKSGSADNVFSARKFTVAAEISTYSGENKQILSGNLNAVGDPVLGTFNTTSSTFTEGEEAAASA